MNHSLKMHNSLEYIEKNLSSRLELDELAKKAYMSKYHYHRLFHKAVGESLNKYISRRRMERAAFELVETDEPIIDIALKYQYGSQEAFSRAFKRVYDITPGKYRRMFSSRRAVDVMQLSARFNQIRAVAA